MMFLDRAASFPSWISHKSTMELAWHLFILPGTGLHEGPKANRYPGKRIADTQNINYFKTMPSRNRTDGTRNVTPSPDGSTTLRPPMNAVAV